MCSPFLRFFLGCAVSICAVAATAQVRELRVCADPNNMPFSNMRRQGFENRIAELVARDLGAHLTYVWQRMGRGFVREYLDKQRCDLIIGIPSNYRSVLATSPYYRSTYVFVSRRDQALKAVSFNSPELHGLKIGVQLVEEEYTPPGEALARRGLQSEIVAFDTTGDGADSIIRAVATRHIDLAVAWGPLAGYFAQKYGRQLELAAVQPEVDPPGLPFSFSISMGVRKGNRELKDELDEFLVKHQPSVSRILNEYGIPQLSLASRPTDSAPGN